MTSLKELFIGILSFPILLWSCSDADLVGKSQNNKLKEKSIVSSSEDAVGEKIKQKPTEGNQNSSSESSDENRSDPANKEKEPDAKRPLEESESAEESEPIEEELKAVNPCENYEGVSGGLKETELELIGSFSFGVSGVSNIVLVNGFEDQSENAINKGCVHYSGYLNFVSINLHGHYDSIHIHLSGTEQTLNISIGDTATLDNLTINASANSSTVVVDSKGKFSCGKNVFLEGNAINNTSYTCSSK